MAAPAQFCNPLPASPEFPMQRDAHLNNAALMARRRAALPTGLGQT